MTKRINETFTENPNVIVMSDRYAEDVTPVVLLCQHIFFELSVKFSGMEN
jgi:hypothetical protein